MGDYLQLNKSKYLENLNQLKELKKEKKEYDTTAQQLKTIRDKLFLDVMLPIPPTKNTPLAFMEGTAVHTNEILVSLGANYFAKMTASDAVQFCARKSSEIDRRSEELSKEQNLLLERISFVQMSSQHNKETEIVEDYDEEKEKEWRKKHAESIRREKLKEARERKKIDDKPADYYFNRLAELELEEEEEYL